MLQDFIDWLTEQITDRGPAKVLVGATTLLCTVGTIGTLFGSLLLRAAAPIAVLIASLVLVVVLTERKAVNRQLASASTLLQHYCETVEEGSSLKLKISEWRQTVAVNPRGDAVVVRRIKATPIHGHLRFLYCRLRYYGATPLSARTRRSVRWIAREISVDGREGPRLLATGSWNGENEHVVIVYFTAHVLVGQEVVVEVQWIWPRFSIDLMQGGVEDFDITFTCPVERAIQALVLGKRKKRDRFLVAPIARRGHVDLHTSDSAYHAAFIIERPTRDIRYGIRVDKAQ
jgi:hypothetical protein